MFEGECGGEGDYYCTELPRRLTRLHIDGCYVNIRKPSHIKALRELQIYGSSIVCDSLGGAQLDWTKLGGTALQKLHMDDCYIDISSVGINFTADQEEFQCSDLSSVQHLTHLDITLCKGYDQQVIP